MGTLHQVKFASTYIAVGNHIAACTTTRTHLLYQSSRQQEHTQGPAMFRIAFQRRSRKHDARATTFTPCAHRVCFADDRNSSQQAERGHRVGGGKQNAKTPHPQRSSVQRGGVQQHRPRLDMPRSLGHHRSSG